MESDLERHVRVFRNGRNRAVRIPVEFDFPGDEVIMRKEGSRIIIEPVVARSDNLVAWLRSLPPLDENVPDLDLDEPPPEPVDL